MSRRKGELSSAGIDRGWPHQVALPAELCCGANTTLLHAFLDAHSAAPRTRWVTARWACGKGELHHVYCFSVGADADAFAAAFGGTRFDPRRDRSGQGGIFWQRDGEYRRLTESGPLSVAANGVPQSVSESRSSAG